MFTEMYGDFILIHLLNPYLRLMNPPHPPSPRGGSGELVDNRRVEIIIRSPMPVPLGDQMG